MPRSLQPARIASHVITDVPSTTGSPAFRSASGPPGRSPGRLSWRPAGPDDIELLRSLFAESRPELGLLPEPVRDQLLRLQFEAQRDQYRRNAPDAVDRIVEIDQDGWPEPVGRCYLWAGPDEHRLLDLAVRPQWRGRGVGGAVLACLCADAARAGVPLSLSVWADNRAAQRLYRRLGFVQQDDVVAGGYLAMRWSAGDAR